MNLSLTSILFMQPCKEHLINNITSIQKDYITHKLIKELTELHCHIISSTPYNKNFLPPNIRNYLMYNLNREMKEFELMRNNLNYPQMYTMTIAGLNDHKEMYYKYSGYISTKGVYLARIE